MLSGLNKDADGQALVEFALILVVLLTMIFTIVESARLFQGWLTVQNAARAAGRYAITGQFETDCLTVFPPCLDPRVDSIEDEARRTIAGVPVNPNVLVGQPGSLAVEVWGQDEDGVWYPDYAGASGQNVRIQVTYYMPIVTPLLQPIADMVPLTGQVVAINEDFDQFSTSLNTNEPPSTGDIGGPIVVPEADIFITKVVASPDVKAGPPPSIYTIKDVKFDIEVRNKGPFDAENVTINDLLPPNFKYVGYSATRGATCDAPQDPPQITAQINCLLPDLAGDAGRESEKVVYLTITARTPIGPLYEILTNTVSVSMDPTAVDPVPADNVDTAGLELIPHVDLRVTKNDTMDPAIVSVPLTYKVWVRNLGPNTAENVVLTDRLPHNFTYQSYSIGKGSCTVPVPPDRDLLCNIGDLNASSTVLLQVIGIPEVEGLMVNESWATNTIHEDNPYNNSNSENTTVTVVADLEISKSAPAQVDWGENIQYELNVTNNGPSPVNNVDVVDILPEFNGNPAVQYISSSPECTSHAADHVDCLIPSLAVGQNKQLTIDVRAILPGNAVNQVNVTSTAIDPDPVNNWDNASTIIRAISDLSLTKSVAGPAIPGQDLNFTLDVTNNGPSPAPGITLRDTLDPNIELNKSLIFVSGCDSWDLIGNEIVCDINYLNDGATALVNLIVPVKSGVNPSTTELNNNATVTFGDIDPVPGNNGASASTNFEFPANLSITKIGPPQVEVSQDIVYQIQVTNLGPYNAANVVVEDILPAQVSFVSASPAGNCSLQISTVTCTFLQIASGSSLPIQIQTSAVQQGLADNTASATADTIDLDPGDNSATAQTNILPRADVSIDLDLGSTSLNVISNTQFTIGYNVGNVGPSPADNVSINIVTDVPSGDLALFPSTASCTLGSLNGDASIDCNLGQLANGVGLTVDINVSISSPGSYTHSATISTTTSDPNLTNNGPVNGTIEVN